MKPFCSVCGNFMSKIGKTEKRWYKTSGGLVAVERTNFFKCRKHPNSSPIWEI